MKSRLQFHLDTVHRCKLIISSRQKLSLGLKRSSAQRVADTLRANNIKCYESCYLNKAVNLISEAATCNNWIDFNSVIAMAIRLITNHQQHISELNELR